MDSPTPIPVADGETTPVRVGAGHYKLGRNDLIGVPSNPMVWQIFANGRFLAEKFPTKRSAVAYVLNAR